MADEEDLEGQYERTDVEDDKDEQLKTYDWLELRTGLPKGTLYAFVHDGRIPHVRLGKRLVRFRRRDIEHWLKRHTVAASL
jgi:excisionase family DNA binding protein